MERRELARRLGAEAGVAAGAARAEGGGRVVIAEAESARFRAAFADAVAGGGDVFLADPQWGAKERGEMERLLAGIPAGGERAEAPELGWLMIPSGGTGGKVKFARHDAATIAAAVRGCAAHFGFATVNAVGVLPLHHVSGLMSWMRCALTGGEYRAWDWKRLERGERPELAGAGPWVISLVPTQLQRLLGQPDAVAWLRELAAIFVGGGPAWPALLEAAAAARLPIALSYGMTETGAMVTALRPEEFAAGVRSSGAALPHAWVRFDGEGRVIVGGASLLRGYYPAAPETVAEFATEDLGRIDERGHLHVLGRRDAVIITGGRKVLPAEVEAGLRASGQFEDVAVVGVPDAEWGESVVACYPAGGREPDPVLAVAALAAWQRPKRFVAVGAWPRNAQGKLNRAALLAQVRGAE
jgi:O-succinylbenzoic acid--CoA ligase